MTITQAIQLLYRKQDLGQISPDVVGFFHWMRWNSHPYGVLTGSAKTLATSYSPTTTRQEVERWLNSLKRLGLVARVSKRGAKIPKWRILCSQQAKKNPQKEKATPKQDDSFLPF